MNKKLAIVMSVVWGVIIVALVGLLIYFINTGSAGNFVFYKNKSVTGTVQNYQKSFDSDSINTISVKVANAEISYQKSNTDKIVVNVKNNSKSSSIDVTNSTHSIDVTQDGVNFNFFNFEFGESNSCSVVIEVPENYNKEITLKTASGDIDVEPNLNVSKIDFESASGEITTNSIKASSIKIVSVSGDVKVSSAEGDTSLKTTSGEIELGTLNGSGTLKSISGSITCSIEKLTGGLDINSVSGDEELSINENVGALVTAKSVSGDVSSNYPMTSSNDHNATISIGDASNNVSASTVSGEITVNK